MSGGADFDAEEESKCVAADEVADARPARLGLGAKYLSHSQANRVSSQVDKKLRAKLIPTARAGIRVWRDPKAANREEIEDFVEAENQDEEDDSRASSFKKRSSAFVRPTLTVSETTGSKKKKRKGSVGFS